MCGVTGIQAPGSEGLARIGSFTVLAWFRQRSRLQRRNKEVSATKERFELPQEAACRWGRLRRQYAAAVPTQGSSFQHAEI